MLEKAKKNLFFNLLFILILAGMIGITIYYGNLKQGFHMDEILTYGLSNSYYNPFPFESGKWLPSSYYENYLTVNGTDAFAYASVYSNQVADVHPPLYYFIIHTLSSFFQQGFNKWIGLSVNIFFYIVTAFLVLSLVKYLTKDKWVALAVTTVWAFSIGTISSVMYTRMYVLLTMFLVAFLFVGIKLLNEEVTSKNIYYILFIVSVLGTLTQYYFLIGAFFISFIVCVLLFIQKRWRVLTNFVITMFLGLSTSLLLFPAVLKHLFATGRGKEAIVNISGVENYFLDFIKILDRFIFGNQGFLFISVLFLLIISAFLYSLFNKKDFNFNFKTTIMNIIILVVPAILYLLVIQKIAPYRTARYIYPIFPIVIISFLYLLFLILQIFTKNNKIVKSLVAIVSIFWTMYTFNKEPVDYLYTNYSSVLNTVKKYENNEALVIHDQIWKITGNILELKSFNSILPLIVDPNAPVLPVDEKITNNDGLVVFIDIVYNQTNMVEAIMNQYNFSNVEELYTQNNTIVYFFE